MRGLLLGVLTDGIIAESKPCAGVCVSRVHGSWRRFAGARGRPIRHGDADLGVIEFLLSGVCHQIPEHSLHFQGVPLVLCARCTGTFTGLVVGLLVLRILGQGRRTGLPRRRVMAILLALAALWAFDGINSSVGQVLGRGPLYASSKALRVVTGLGMGMALSVFLCPISNYAMWGDGDARRVLERGALLVPLALVEGGVGAVLLLWRDAPHGLMTAWVTVAVAVSLILINSTLVVLLFHREGYAERWTQRVIVLLTGLVLTVAETGGLALVRRFLVG